MDEYSRSNRNLWNEWAHVNAASDLYRLDEFKTGVVTLNDLERSEVGDVAGKSMLHLQCHFGMDTLSWARLGAKVTGVDFSEEAIDMARQLADEMNLPARFLCSDIYALDEVLQEQFDIVYTSYGVLNWLSDIPRWAKIAADHVKPFGIFYIAEFHPFAMVMDDEADSYCLRYPYFEKNVLSFKVQGSYADRHAKLNTMVEYGWNHTLGEIVTSLIEAGLTIEFLHEFPFSVYEQLPFLIADKGRWAPPEDPAMLPLMFSLRASKREG
jgi:2-polyprenyl-3-methyl-5-hydroxy-6-metoxy-1,4-benzoquinol methylase